MRILMISAEGPPLRRGGALVETLAALPEELRARGHQVSVILPFYREIRENNEFHPRETGVTVDLRVGEETHVAEYLEGQTESGLQLFLIRADAFFDRPGIYGEGEVAYEDNAARFIFLAKAAIELARRLTPVPQILHCHDWGAALVPVYVDAHALPFRTVLTIHIITEQGSFWGLDFDLTNLPTRYFTLRGLEFFGRLNFLKSGIVFADRVTTVSEHYRHEILERDAGAGLEVVLRENSSKLSGILSGIDNARWNPGVDKLLPATFGGDDLAGKQECRVALLKKLQLAPAPRGPVFSMVARVVSEKGFGLLTPLLDRLLADDVRLIILGGGNVAFETALAVAARRYPTKFIYRPDYDEDLAHLIEAGADITLTLSRFEPSGLLAMQSLKYGTLPVAHAGGGIREIVQDYDPVTDSGHGFLFYDYTADAFWDAIKRAAAIFADADRWNSLRQRAMRQEFSWARATERYEELYRGLVGDES